MKRFDRRMHPRKAHVRHILVATKPDAKTLLDELQSAKHPLKQFKKLAKKYSNCPSAKKGGDLGEFVEGQMAQDFEDAVWSAQIEQLPTSFVKTQFGFHLIWVHTIKLPVQDGGRTKI